MGEISTFGLELFSSSQIFYKGRARFINLPATDGGHTFLPHHENVIIALVPGTTKIVTETGEEITAVTGSGFAEMINNRVQVFVHSAEHPGEIDINRAKEALERAEDSARSEQSPDFVEIDLRDAFTALGEITGHTLHEQIIDRIFEKFCLGK